MSTPSFVLVGGGLAAATAAETLRDEGFDGGIRILAGERHLPYLRPPLTKGYFSGQETRESIFVHPADWYDDHDIDLELNTTVVSLDVAGHTVTRSDDSVVSFDRLLLATGASPRRLTVPGADAAGIFYVRTVDDSEALRSRLESGASRVVIVGAGWIGLEIASAARGYGNDVTVIGRETIPLQGPLGDELGTVFRNLHEANAVSFLLPTAIRSFVVEAGRVTGIDTDTETLAADLVVVGVGAVPTTELASRAGLEVDNGLLVDEHLASSDVDVFGAGDLANAYHPVINRRMRNEHWANAIATGKVAARSMLGRSVGLDDIPYFYTDQFDLGMEYSGYPPLTTGASVVIRGDINTRTFVAFWVVRGAVVAGMNVNVWDVNDAVQGLIRSARVVNLSALADPNVPLADL